MTSKDSHCCLAGYRDQSRRLLSRSASVIASELDMRLRTDMVSVRVQTEAVVVGTWAAVLLPQPMAPLLLAMSTLAISRVPGTKLSRA